MNRHSAPRMQTWRRYVMHASAARKRKRELLAQADVYDSMLNLAPGPSSAVTAMCWVLKANAARRAAKGIVG